MKRILSGSAVACALMFGGMLPAAALTTVKAAPAVTANAVVLAQHDDEWRRRKKGGDSQIQRDDRNRDHFNHDDNHWKKKRRHSRPNIHFYYDPWPYYGYHYDPFYYPYNYPYWDDGYYYRPRISHKRHVRWCKANYRTYNARTDMYIGKNGKKRRCNSPYDGR